MNIYTLLVEANGHKTKRLAYLLYYHPIGVREHALIQFEISVQEVPTDPEAAERWFKDAVAVLNGPAPSSSARCGFCTWRGTVGDWEKNNNPRP